MSDSRKIDYIQEKVDSVAETVSKIDKDVALQKAALDSHTAQDERMYEELRRMNDILQQNTESLKEHMHRSDLLEEILTNVNKRLEPIEVEHIQRTAVKEWVAAKTKILVRVGKVAGALVAIAGAWVYFKPLIEHFIK